MSDGEIMDGAAIDMGLASGAAGVNTGVDEEADTDVTTGVMTTEGQQDAGHIVGRSEVRDGRATGDDVEDGGWADVPSEVETAVESEGDTQLLAEAITEEDRENGSPRDAVVEGAGPRRLAQLENEGDIAADYLEELLDIADMDGDIDTFVEGERAHVSIVTDSEVLVGKHGEVLDALQELARLAVMTETGHRSRLMLDVAGHRARRQKELQLLAQDAIGEVRSSGEPVRLEPMNPFERKIVHDAVAAAGLVSESEGQEPHRRVVVRPAD